MRLSDQESVHKPDEKGLDYLIIHQVGEKT